MRELHECQAEVFRRSEKRIKARSRRRKRILTACIPLVFCIVLVCGFVLPEMTPERAADSAPAEDALNGMGQNTNQSVSCPVSQITVSGGDFSRSYTDSSDVLQISNCLSSLGQTGTVSNGTAGEGLPRGDKYSSDTVYESIADSTGKSYTITLINQENEKKSYVLMGNTVTNLTSAQSYTLSQAQSDELYELLGIPAAAG